MSTTLLPTMLCRKKCVCTRNSISWCVLDSLIQWNAPGPQLIDICFTRAAPDEDVEEDVSLPDARAPAREVTTELPKPQTVSGARALDYVSAQRLTNPEWWAEYADRGWPSTERLLVDWSSALGFLFYLPDSQVMGLMAWQSLF